MTETKKDQFKDHQTNQENNSNKDRGPQGIDKAPGEETAGDFENVVQDTQKAKNKVDGDPSKPEDHPNQE